VAQALGAEASGTPAGIPSPLAPHPLPGASPSAALQAPQVFFRLHSPTPTQHVCSARRGTTPLWPMPIKFVKFVLRKPPSARLANSTVSIALARQSDSRSFQGDRPSTPVTWGAAFGLSGEGDCLRILAHQFGDGW
jgi:hypothetical protein